MVTGILFSSYNTAHEETDVLSDLANKKLENFEMDSRLKDMLIKCLGEEKSRPDLK